MMCFTMHCKSLLTRTRIAGKHVLLEKPATANAEEAERLVAAAREKGVVLLEAFHYRFHPAMQRALEIVESGELGQIRRIECRAGIPNVLKADDIRYNLSLAGGACMDIGAYVVNATRAVLGGEVPERVYEAKAELASPDIDHTMKMVLDFADGVTAVGEASLRGSWFRPIPSLRVIGSKKELHLRNFMLPMIWHRLYVKELPNGATRTETHYGDGSTTYSYMLRHFLALCRGETSDYIVTSDDTVDNMRTLDMIYRAAGLSIRGHHQPEN
jgi:predicted dehydrogenase